MKILNKNDLAYSIRVLFVLGVVQNTYVRRFIENFHF